MNFDEVPILPVNQDKSNRLLLLPLREGKSKNIATESVSTEASNPNNKSSF